MYLFVYLYIYLFICLFVVGSNSEETATESQSA